MVGMETVLASLLPSFNMMMINTATTRGRSESRNPMVTRVVPKAPAKTRNKPSAA